MPKPIGKLTPVPVPKTPTQSNFGRDDRGILIDYVFTGRNGIESPSGKALVKTAEETAKNQVEKEFEQQENATVQDVVNSLMANGTPLNNITADQLLSNENIKKAGLNNLGKIKNILDSYKANKQDSAKAMATSGVNEIIKFADRIPASDGFFGLKLQGPWNQFQGQYNENIASALQNLDANISSTLASLAKAFGEVGNLSQFDQESYKKSLQLLASPNLKIRKDARESLQNRLTKDLGFDVKISNPYDIKKQSQNQQQPQDQKNNLSKVPTEELLKQLGL